MIIIVKNVTKTRVAITLCCCLLLIPGGSSIPIGWSPQNHAIDTSVSRGPLAGVATSAEPSPFFSWLMRLFAQKSFLTWLNGYQVQPKQTTQKVSTNVKTFTKHLSTDREITRTQNFIEISTSNPAPFKISNNISSSSHPPLTLTDITPKIARDFAADDLVIVARTRKSETTTMPGYDIKQKQSTIAVARDYMQDKIPVPQGDLNVAPSLPMVEINRGVLQTISASSVKTTTDTGVSVSSLNTLPKELEIARDKSETNGIATTPDNLVVIRDVIEDEAQDPDHVVPTQDPTHKVDINMDEKTLAPGSNIIVLLPKDKFKFIT